MRPASNNRVAEIALNNAEYGSAQDDIRYLIILITELTDELRSANERAEKYKAEAHLLTDERDALQKVVDAAEEGPRRACIEIPEKAAFGCREDWEAMLCHKCHACKFNAALDALHATTKSGHQGLPDTGAERRKQAIDK